MSREIAARNKDSWKVLTAKVSVLQEAEFVSELEHTSTTGRTRGFELRITIKGPQRRSSASLYALVQAALRVQEFHERSNSSLALEEKPHHKKEPRASLERGQCTLDQCRRLLDCDCLGLYDTNDRGI